MERQKSFAEYPDSDQSISEEEECNSLRGLAVQKEKFQILSQLELQKGYDERIHSRKIRNLSYEKEDSLFLDDDVEIPSDKDNLNCSPRKTRAWKPIEDIINNDKFEENDHPDCGNKRQDSTPTWCTINQEAEALIHENKVLSSSSSHSTFSKVDRPCKGIRGKAKPKFSFHFQSHRRELSHSGTTKDEHHALFNLHKQPGTESETGLHFPMECLEDIEEKNDEKLDITHAEVEDSRREHSETSIAELLDGLQDNTSLQSVGIVIRKKRQIATKRAMLLSFERHNDNEDSTKSMDSDSPSECEDGGDQNLKFFIPKTSRQTITDKFDEFLGATSLDTDNAVVPPPEQSRIGLFGKLQQVMQTEKLRDVDFLDMLHSETSANDETDYLDVKILDKDFKAKLIVCSCFFQENLKNSLPPYTPNMKSGMKKKKVIFNPRVCNNVDLGVGTFIRIHAPWKEISVGNGDSIILSTYFSETYSR